MSEELLIRSIIEAYFSGLHHGDAAQLESIFHPDCMLKAPSLRLSLNEWLERVRRRPVPADNNHPWYYDIISIEIHHEQAMVKVNCPLPHGHFIDYLGLLREQGQWRIVNKMYALKEPEPCPT